MPTLSKKQRRNEERAKIEEARDDMTNASLATRTLWAMAMLVVAVIALGAGLWLRRELWTWTVGARYRYDLQNAYNWGQHANRVGLFRIYDQVAAGEKFSQMTALDYSPLRLAIVTAWVHWTHLRFPKAHEWQSEYEFTAPLLWLNSAAEIVSAVLIFLLVRWWKLRATPIALTAGSGIPWMASHGLLAALLFWFNPAVLWDAHIWPQWDVWLIPFFLAGVLFACANWWFCAGASIAIGAMLKGQMLLVVPMLILWPLFERRWAAAIRLVAGLTFAAAVIALPWLHLSRPAVMWVLGATAAGAMAPLAMRRRIPPVLLAVVAGIAVFLTIPLFHASDAWYRIALVGGADHYRLKVAGIGVYNLPALMRWLIQWPIVPQSAITIPGINVEITFRTTMLVAYGSCLVLIAKSAANLKRQRDTRFLLAMVVPWGLFYALLPQMHSRYLVWCAAFSTMLFSVRWWIGTIGILTGFVAVCGMATDQFRNTPDWSPDAYRLLQAAYPYAPAALLSMMVIYFLTSILKGRRVTEST
jgi:hypothetical protein